MITKEITTGPVLRGHHATEGKQPMPDDVWENCKGQCGTTPWCRDCQLEKQKLHEERLNRQGRSDDKKE